MRQSFATHLVTQLLVVFAAHAGGAESCDSRVESCDSGAEFAPKALSLVQLQQKLGKPDKPVIANTHVDPLNVSTAEYDKARYKEDWTTEWKQNPNPTQHVQPAAAPVPAP